MRPPTPLLFLVGFDDDDGFSNGDDDEEDNDDDDDDERVDAAPQQELSQRAPPNPPEGLVSHHMVSGMLWRLSPLDDSVTAKATASVRDG